MKGEGEIYDGEDSLPPHHSEQPRVLGKKSSRKLLPGESATSKRVSGDIKTVTTLGHVAGPPATLSDCISEGYR